MNKLLDQYENSLLAVGENTRRVHIEMPFNERNFPAYFDESSMEYEQIHISMKDLEQRGLVQIIWKDGKSDYLISKIRLNTLTLNQAYQYVNRTSKLKQTEFFIEWLKNYDMNLKSVFDDECFDYSVLHKFITYIVDRLENHQSVKEYIDIFSIKDAQRFLDAIKYVETNTELYYVREFSIEHFGDSKFFGDIESKVARVFRVFGNYDEDVDMSELMAEHMIFHTPNYVYLKGAVTVMIGGQYVDLAQLKQGIGISGEDIENLEILDRNSLKKVITVENLTTFFRMEADDCMLIYLGGYHNQTRRRLIRKIHHTSPDADYYHFGDIDAGGFHILLDLQKKTEIDFKALYMDLETLKKYERYGRELTLSDRKRLNKLRNEGCFVDVIDYMLDRNVKLEQECIEC